MILAFVFILTAAFLSTIAVGQEPLSIKVGAYANHPKIFMDADGKVSGFWPDLIKDIAKKVNWKIEYIWGTWSDGLDHLINEEIAIMPDVAFTEKRNKLYAFSEAPVLMSWTRVYVNKENTGIQSITDLKNKKIAALKGSVNLEGFGGLREIALGFNLNCTFSELDNYTEVFKAIEENRVDANPKCLEIFGVQNVEAVKGFKLFEDPNISDKFKKRIRAGEPVSYESEFDFDKVRELDLYETSKTGKCFLELFITSCKTRGYEQNEFLVHIIDITERKQAEKELHRANRALKTFSECNQAVVRAREEPHLLHKICRIIVDIGGYRLAWVGFAKQDEAKTVQPVAQAGYEEGYPDTLNITWADTERGRGPTGTAIRAGKPIVVKNILTDPNYTPWRAEASKRGYESGIALPLISNGQTFGTLNIYAEEPDAFDAEEIKLLMDLADDLAYGIMALRILANRKQAEEELRNSREQLRNLSSYLQSEREKERTSIAREIHDELGQALTAFKMDLSWLDKRLPEEQKQLFEKTKSMSELIHTTILTVQRILTDLRPGLFDDFGLMAATEWQAEEFQKRSGIKCEIDIENEDIILDKDRSTGIYNC